MKNTTFGHQQFLALLDRLGLDLDMRFRLICKDGRTDFDNEYDNWDDLVFDAGAYMAQNGFNDE
jgi:hypothetical protein